MAAEYTTTAQDMDAYLEGWPTHPATPWQRERYPQDRPLKREQLGNNHSDALCLEINRHGDADPVGDSKVDTVKHFFWTGENAYRRPNDRFLTRFARFMGYSVPQALCLVLKGQFQRYFVSASEVGNPQVEEPNGHCYKNHRQEVERLNRDFVPGLGRCLDAEGLFNLFEGLGRWASTSGYDLESFKALCHTIISHGMHLVANKGPHMDKFVAFQQAQQDQLNAAPKARQELFHRLNLRRLGLEEMTGDWLLERENLAFSIQKSNQRWMREFGESYLLLIDILQKNHNVERMLEMKNFDPGLSREELERAIQESLDQARSQLERLKEELEIARMLNLPGITGLMSGCGTCNGKDEINAYTNECKKLLREIEMRTHPDRYTQESFTPDQCEKLDAYFKEAQSLKKRLLIYSGFDTVFDMIPMLKLENILALVMALWESIGIDFDELRMVIRGKTLDEQITWLHKQVEQLEGEIATIRDEMKAMREDPEVISRLGSLASEEAKAETHRQLQEKLAEAQAKLAVRQSELARLLGEEPGDGSQGHGDDPSPETFSPPVAPREVWS